MKYVILEKKIDKEWFLHGYWEKTDSWMQSVATVAFELGRLDKSITRIRVVESDAVPDSWADYPKYI